jgi:hypothetical protein
MTVEYKIWGYQTGKDSYCGLLCWDTVYMDISVAEEHIPPTLEGSTRILFILLDTTI